MNLFPTSLYAFSITGLEDESAFHEAYQQVSQERRIKTDRLRLLKDKQRSLGAGLLLKHALEQIGISPEQTRFLHTEKGKPFLDGYDHVHFNLSHAGELVLCAISPEEIGCDVEKIAEKEKNGKATLPQIAERFFHPAEYEYLLRQKTERLQAETFYRFWTLKESFLKATGEGLSLPLGAFQIHLDQTPPSITQAFDQKNYYLCEYDAFPEYKCSICGCSHEIAAPGQVPLQIFHLPEVRYFS